MHHDVPDDLRHLLAAVQEFLQREVLPLEEKHHDIASRGEMTPEFWDLCRQVQKKAIEAGIHGMFMSPAYGGIDLGEYPMCLVREQSAIAGSHFAMLILGDLPFGPNKMLQELCTPEQAERFLTPLVHGDATTGIALTEPHAGSDLASIKTTAARTEGGWLLNGTKHFITNAPYADFLQVLARSENGFSMFLVERDRYEVGRLQHSMGGDDIQAEVIFNDSFVPLDCLLGEEGKAFQYAMEFLGNERLTMAVFSIGMAVNANDLAKEWARSRVSFGKPIIEHQAIQFMIADNETEIYAGRAMTYDAAQRCDLGEDVFREISMAKLYCSEMVGRVVDRAVQIFGGMGYMRESPVERLYRLARILRIAGGSSEIQRMIIGRTAQ